MSRATCQVQAGQLSPHLAAPPPLHACPEATLVELGAQVLQRLLLREHPQSLAFLHAMMATTASGQQGLYAFTNMLSQRELLGLTPGATHVRLQVLCMDVYMLPHNHQLIPSWPQE